MDGLIDLFAIDRQFFIYTFCFGVLIISDLLLSAIICFKAKCFTIKDFFYQVLKYIAVLIVMLALYITGGLIPDLIILNINGNEANLQTAITIILIAAISKCGIDCLRRLVKLFNVSEEINQINMAHELEQLEELENLKALEDLPNLDELITHIDAEKGNAHDSFIDPIIVNMEKAEIGEMERNDET